MPRERDTVRSTYAGRSASLPLFGGRILAGILAFVALGTLILLVSLWWFKIRVNTEAEIRRDGFDFQVSSEDRVLSLNRDLVAIDTQLAGSGLSPQIESRLRAQREAIAADLCDTAARVNNPKPTVAAIIAEEC